MGKFLTKDQPMLTVMLQCQTPEVAIGRIRNANCLGADAYGLQIESLLREYQTPEIFEKIFKEMNGRPVYVTNYRKAQNKGRTDEELAEGLLLIFRQFQTQSRKTGIQGLSHFFHSKLLIRHSHCRLSQPDFRRRDRRG